MGASYFMMTKIANGRVGSMEGKNKTSHPLCPSTSLDLLRATAGADDHSHCHFKTTVRRDRLVWARATQLSVLTFLLSSDGEIAKDPNFVPNKSWRQKE